MVFFYSDLLSPSNEEWDSAEDDLWAHALHCSTYRQIQLSTERELRCRTQVTQRLQTLRSNNTQKPHKWDKIVIFLPQNNLN